MSSTRPSAPVPKGVVYTSTVGTLGLEGAARGQPATEACYADVGHLFGSYKRSKYVAEHEVLRAAAQGLPVTIVLPTFPSGPRDRGPTPTGRLILDFLNGRVPGYVDTALNVVHVDDVASGHILALERAASGAVTSWAVKTSRYRSCRPHRRLTGLPAPRLHVPRTLAMSVARMSELVEGRLLRREPAVPLEAARMSTTHMIFDDTRARKELRYTSRPPGGGLEDSARWFIESGYVRPGRRAKISWSATSHGPPPPNGTGP